MNRRAFLSSAASFLATTAYAETPIPEPARLVNTSSLTQAARKSGRLLGMYTVAHELQTDAQAAAIIANTFSLIADGNDLKFADRLRPTPTTFNFGPGDAAVAWAEQHNKLFRGHCLVWWNALPKWFPSYVTAANAKQVMREHISTVVKHYAGRVYSWDVINEAIYHDNRPDGLRRKPWLDFIGPDYLDIAFHTAHEADPKARLVLNECYIEHDSPAEIGRRASFLALASRLKKSGVPITTVGIEAHLRGNTPLDKPGMTTFLEQVRALGLEIMVTELDVDDVNVPGNAIDETVSSKYNEFIELVGPYVKVITFEQLRDDPTLPKRPDGLAHRPNLFDAQYQPAPAFRAATRALAELPRK